MYIIFDGKTITFFSLIVQGFIYSQVVEETLEEIYHKYKPASVDPHWPYIVAWYL